MGINADELREARIRHLQRTAALLKAARREKRASIYEPDNATLKAALKYVERLLAEARHETAAARR